MPLASVVRGLRENKSQAASFGFTLIELMVTIAILAILISAGLYAFSNAQRNARDSRRRADMDAISKTMEQYFANNDSVYPTSAQGIAVAASYFPTGSSPVETKPGYVPYAITFGPTGITYCTCALLENVGKGNSSANTCVYGGAGSLDYYCLSQRQ